MKWRGSIRCQKTSTCFSNILNYFLGYLEVKARYLENEIDGGVKKFYVSDPTSSA